MSIDEIETFAQTHDAQIQFTKLAEAREYRETVSLLADLVKAGASGEAQETEFPRSLVLS